jgi:hypothetical protein
MANTSFWDAPNRTSPSGTDRFGLQRGNTDAGEHITLNQVRDFTYTQVSGLTEKTTLTGTEEIFIRDAGTNKKILASTLINDPAWIVFPIQSARYITIFGRQALRCRKIRNKVVLQGVCGKLGTETSNSTTALIGTLPAGYRPSTFVSFQACVVNPHTIHNINIDTDGSVYFVLQNGSSTIPNGLEINLTSCFFFTD